MTNPNNCDTCDYKQMRAIDQDDKQHCYMFYASPEEQCMQHTGHKKADNEIEYAFNAMGLLKPDGGIDLFALAQRAKPFNKDPL